MLAKLVEAYAIPLASAPPFRQPRDPEGAYLVTGYSECIHSFFAFGLPLRRIRCAAFASNDSAGAGQVCALCHKTLDTEKCITVGSVRELRLAIPVIAPATFRQSTCVNWEVGGISLNWRSFDTGHGRKRHISL